MTVQAFLEDLYEATGKNTMLSPYTAGNFDITTSGSVKMLGWLNRGYRFLTKLKLTDGTMVKFPVTEAEMYFKTCLIEGTVTSCDATTHVVTLDTEIDTTADQYNGWLLSIEDGTGAGQIRMVVDSADLTVTPHTAWDTDPDSTSTYALYKRFCKFLISTDGAADEHISMTALNDIVNVLNISDVDHARDLRFGGRTVNYPGSLCSSGTPMEWFRYARGIYFDVAPKEELWYRMEYEKQVATLSSGDDTPEIPDQWQEALFMWLVWKARVWSFEPNAAYGAKKDFFDFCRSIQLPLEGQMERMEGGAELDRGD